MFIKHRQNHFSEDIYEFGGKVTNHFFDIEQYGTTYENPAYELYHNPHRFHVFEYVVSGKGFIHTTDNTYEVKAGDFYFIRSGFVGHYGADKDDPYRKIWVNISGTMVTSLADMFGVDEPVLIRNIGDDARNIILAIHNILNTSEDADNRKVLGTCSSRIFELLSLAVGYERIKSSEYQARFSDKVKQYINGHIFDPLKLNDLAEHFYVTSSYLIRKFKRETGITPMRYYNLCRIDAARNLLSFYSAPVKEVASKLNYADSAYFSNRFKEETGYAPSEYTREIHANCSKSTK